MRGRQPDCSYDFSRGGEENAENTLHITDQSQADAFAAFADQIAQRYAGQVRS